VSDFRRCTCPQTPHSRSGPLQRNIFVSNDLTSWPSVYRNTAHLDIVAITRTSMPRYSTRSSCSRTKNYPEMAKGWLADVVGIDLPVFQESPVRPKAGTGLVDQSFDYRNGTAEIRIPQAIFSIVPVWIRGSRLICRDGWRMEFLWRKIRAPPPPVNRTSRGPWSW